MNTNLLQSLWLSAVLVAMSPAALAQDDKPAPQSGTTQTPVAELIEQLGDRNYQTRRAAEGALRARGKEALEQLRKAAAEHSDDEVQWRAQRLVKQIESGQDGTLQRRRALPPPVEDGMPWRSRLGPDRDLEDMFSQMFEQLERDFGVDVPRARFFHDDFFRGLQEQMEEARRGMAMGLPGRGQAMSMRMDENGVRVEITEKDAEGKSDTKVYEAPDIKTFREKYPEIAQRYLRDGGGVFHFAPRLFRVPQQIPMVPQHDEVEVPPPGERLGVLVEDVPEGVREFLGLEPGHGLRVQGVNEGSLASLLGIEVGDIVLRVGDRAVRGTEDVRAALAAIETGGEVQVTVNRRGAERTLEAKKPAAEEEPKLQQERKLEKRDGDGSGKGSIR